MAIDISGPGPALVRLALDAAMLRHEVISSNIANINTPGYKPMKVSFEDQIRSVMAVNQLDNNEYVESSLNSIKPKVEELQVSNGVNQLDIEMINMAKNTLHYQTLLTGLKNYSSITKMAIKEGKI